MRPGEVTAPSAARHLQALEAAQLADTAKALPASWVVQIEAPYGQLAITPRDGAPIHVRCWVADPVARVVRRTRWQPLL